MKLPLSVYIIRHPNFGLGTEYVKAIYSDIYRNFEDEIAIKSSVPVYYSISDEIKGNQIDINFDDAERIAIFIIVDGNMVLDKNSGWTEYLNKLYKRSSVNGNIRLFPIAIQREVMAEYFDSIGKLNFIRVFEKEEKDKLPFLLLDIKHELCRMLFDIERVDEANANTRRPVKLFLSHAKRDGLQITKCVRKFINDDTGINDFFDAVDIEPGKDFLREIEDNINNSNLLIAFQSDGYAKSEWCKKEILLAKEKDIPILIVNCLKNGEDRSFPYLGNAKSICVEKDDSSMNIKVISAAMSEILKKESYRKNVKQIIKEIGTDNTNIDIRCNSPELIGFGSNEKNDGIIIYPDPPIGKFELEMLESRFPKTKLATPIMLYSLTNNYDFQNIKVGVSISESETGNIFGITNSHCEVMSLELARYLIHFGAELLYGGDISYSINKNFTTSLIYIIETYSKEYGVHKKLHNYVAGYLAGKLSIDEMLKYNECVEFIRLEHNEITSSVQVDSEEIVKVTNALDLSDMRKKMTEDLDVRIALGGKELKFSGKYPGILEEILMAIENRKPTFLLGAFGGITAEITYCIMKKSNCFSNNRLQDSGIVQEILSTFNKLVPENRIDYEMVKNKLEELTISDLNNGLSEEENIMLFTSKNVDQIITLILKGINNLIQKGILQNNVKMEEKNE